MKKISKKILSIMMSMLMIGTVLPISVSAATSAEDLQAEIESKASSYSAKISYTSDVYMGSRKIDERYYKNLIYSSRTLNKGYTSISASIEGTIQVPEVIVGVYDGIDVPQFPVSAYIRLNAPYISVSAIILNNENGLYRLAGPYDYLGCSSVWTGDNCKADWVSPLVDNTIFYLMSNRADFPANLKYTRGDYNGYDITVSNVLKTNLTYLKNKLSETQTGYVSSDFNDTGFIFCTSNNGEIYQYPSQIPLGNNSTQYIIDYSPITRISENMLSQFNRIKENAFAYNNDALINYYQAILDIMNFNLKNEMNGIDDSNADNMVYNASARIKELASSYDEAVDNLGEEYVDQTEIREFVQNNYAGATLNVPKAKIKFGSYDPFDYIRNGKTYNFGKNLAYCSPTLAYSSAKTVNNVNSWVVIPSTVVMIYDGVNETSFPVKVGFGTSSSTGEYSGSYLHSLYMGQESNSDPNATSLMFSLGNSSWLVTNASASIPQGAWCTAGQINGDIPAYNTSVATGTNLSKQFGGFFNKIVLDNGKYAYTNKIDPVDGKDISFFFRYANINNDRSSHCVANTSQQFVLNIQPMINKITQMKEDYANTVGANGAERYTSASLLKYDKAIKNLITFDVSKYFENCSDATAYSKVEQCTNDMTDAIEQYNDAFANLKKQYEITFTSYNGEIVSTQTVTENDRPIAPENTRMSKVSETSKYHYVYSWPTLNPATSNLNYRERRASVLCTLDDGVVTKEPTCQENGVKTYTCSVCNGIMTESIDKVSHSYTKYVPNYKNGATYSTTLTHNIQCDTCDNVLASTKCSFELIQNGEAVRIYQCRDCGGMTTQAKQRYTVIFKDQNGKVISEASCYEDGTITVPDLPSDFADEAGHHSFKWNTDPVTSPTTDATYILEESIEKHIFTSYVYNNDATPQNRYGTETARCNIAGCEHTNTRTGSTEQIPSVFTIKGKITLASDTKGTASEIVADRIELAIDGVDANATTDENGEYTIENVAEGEHTITISGDSTIDRNITINVRYDIADYDTITIDDIGIVAFDYNKDGKINTVDAALMSKQSINNDAIQFFKDMFNKAIKYDTITIA